MRKRIWNSLANVKFKALYTCECAKYADLGDRILSIALGLSSSAGVAGWIIWSEHKTMWALIIATSQVVQVARPFIPFFRNESKYLSVSFELESLYLKYRKLWYAFENKTQNVNTIESTFDELCEKELEIEKHGPQCPKINRWENKIVVDRDRALKYDFPQ